MREGNTTYNSDSLRSLLTPLANTVRSSQLILEQMRALSNLQASCKERMDDVEAVVKALKKEVNFDEFPGFPPETLDRLLEAIETCASACSNKDK